MFDNFSLDQLRMLVAVFDLGNFSAAARHLGRVQSAVSHAMSNLERELGLEVWDRSTRVPTPTPAGEAIAQAARAVLAETDRLRRLAATLRGGAEPSLSLCFDQLFPTAATVALCRDFAARFPDVQLRVESETLSAVHERVRSGACHIGIAIIEVGGADLVARHLATFRMTPVAAVQHPVVARQAATGEILTREDLATHVQVVLSERNADGLPDRGVLSLTTWRVADLHTKAELIRAGLGWGNMPRHAIDADLAAGTLVELQTEGMPCDGLPLAFGIVTRTDFAPGPAARWAIQHLGELCVVKAAPGQRESEK